MKLFIKKNYSKYKEVFYYILLFMIFYFSITMNVFILVVFILGLIATISPKLQDFPFKLCFNSIKITDGEYLI